MVDQNESDSNQSENGLLDNTRRQFVAGSAGALALGAGFVAPSLAQDEEDDEGEEAEEPIENEFEDDVDILNYALTLEYLEASFYEEALDNIDEEELCTCGVIGEESELAERAYGELETIRSHEQSHVETLTTTIEDLGGEPAEEPEFDFGLATQYPIAFLATAAQLEDIGVSAYAGAAPFIENGDLLAPALGIHSVEARHAAFLRTLLGETAFPETIDEARGRSEVMDLANGFIVGAEGEELEMMDDLNATDGDVANATDGDVANETDSAAGNATGEEMTNATDGEENATTGE